MFINLNEDEEGGLCDLEEVPRLLARSERMSGYGSSGRSFLLSFSWCGKLKILSGPVFYLDMFQPPPADEYAAEADGDAGENEEDEGARGNQHKVVQLQLEQSWGRLLQVRFCFITYFQLYFLSSVQHFDTLPNILSRC